jgi:hypothetical protein
MCIADYLQKKREAMGPGERLVVDREWIEWVLDTHPCGCEAAESGGLPAPASALGYTVAELGRIFDWSGSTTKLRLAAGVFGDPAMLKPEPPMWNVPPKNVHDLLKKLAQGHRIGPEGLEEPAEDGVHTAANRDAGDTRAGDADAQSPASPPPPPPTRRRSKGRHNGWRKYVDEGPQQPPT